MLFHIVLERKMQLHPRHFGARLRDKLVSKLMKDVEGTCSGRHGFVVAITGIESVGKGLIKEGTGFVTFPVGKGIKLLVLNSISEFGQRGEEGRKREREGGQVFLIFNF
ncbi:hypothetical protein Ancab_022795 [Ancistrocladus abbreviatus]